MGWFGRLFGGGPAARVERARRLVAKGRYNDARIELEGVEGSEAEAVRAEALAALVELNLEEARARLNAGDRGGAAEHIELARAFGATEEQLRSVRRYGREVREAASRAKAAAEAERDAPAVEGDDPLWSLPPDDPRVRFALLVETWPEALRARLLALGEAYAAAVMRLEDGDPAGARQALTAFVEAEPAVRFDRARAALALGQFPAAASDLRAFGDQVGHQRIGNTHTAVLLGQVLARLGRGAEALDILDAELARPEMAGDDPDRLALQATRVGLLEAVGRLEEAEREAARLLPKAPRDLGLYRMLGRLRVALGDRLGAMQALETGLTTCCSSPGKCGNQPFDVEAGRLLARLYLEDRLDPRRAEELLDELSRAVPTPEWEDLYLAALVARNRGDPETPRLVERLAAELSEGDPRRERLAEAFPDGPVARA